MLKKLVLAIVPMALLMTGVRGDDNGLSIDVSNIKDAEVAVVEPGLNVDVDQLTADAGGSQQEQAIEACFRSCGYSGGWGCGYRSWNCGYSSWNYCQPYCSYSSYYCVRPVYHYTCVAAPIYHHYWGCY